MLLQKWLSCPLSDFPSLFIYTFISDVMPALREPLSYSESCKKVKIHNEGIVCSNFKGDLLCPF